MMKNLFEQSRSHWVRYDHYELKAAEDGKRYITPGKNAKPDVYNPLKEVPNIVLDALNVGMLMMGRKPEAEVEKAVMEFITRYGLLGLMTALPTTPSFMDYEAVYLPKNHFIKEESMATDKYLSLFYPFDQLDVVKKGIESTWNVSGDRTMIALTMTFMDEPMAKNMSFQREYAEPYDWVAQQFKDWAFTLTTAFFYYNDYAFMGEDERGLHRKAMAAFGGIAPSYHIELLDKPTIYWDFHSLLLGIQMMFSFMLVVLEIEDPFIRVKLHAVNKVEHFFMERSGNSNPSDAPLCLWRQKIFYAIHNGMVFIDVNDWLIPRHVPRSDGQNLSLPHACIEEYFKSDTIRRLLLKLQGMLKLILRPEIHFRCAALPDAPGYITGIYP